ncbi:MAG: tetratricopeptide repeat protein [bacterium]|nr:tetratricopeptide repeat protein [bacterium]
MGSDDSRILEKQIIREAEGYLELAVMFSDRWPLNRSLRDRLGLRVLRCLAPLEAGGRRRRQTLLLKGQALRSMERYHDALISLDEAAEIDPENANVHLARAWCYKRVGRLERAVACLETAIEHNGDLPILHYNLACYWSLLGNPHLAVAYLSNAFELDETYRDLVADEADFDPVRHHPEFLMLTSVIV